MPAREIEPYGTAVARKERVLECKHGDNRSDVAAGRDVRCKHGAGVARASMRSKVEGIGLEGPHMEERRGKQGDEEGEIFPGLKICKRCLRKRECAVRSDFLSDTLRNPKIALCLMEETNTLQASKIGAAA